MGAMHEGFRAPRRAAPTGGRYHGALPHAVVRTLHDRWPVVPIRPGLAAGFSRITMFSITPSPVPAALRMNSGALAALLAYGLWGAMPLYFRFMAPASALEVVAQRALWSLVLLLAVLGARRELLPLLRGLSAPLLARLGLASALIATNWLVYAWAATHGHAVDASLGYFILPLFNVALGVLLLGERLQPLEWAGVAVAALGVLWLSLGSAGGIPWVALALAVSFSLYGLIKKQSSLPALQGLAVETALMAPLAAAALGWLAQRGELAFGHHGLGTDLLLVSTGLMTTVPLVAFGFAAQRLTLAAMGMWQYVSPTLQFVLGVTVLGETVDPHRLAGFGAVWLGLALFTLAVLRRQRARRARPADAGIV